MRPLRQIAFATNDLTAGEAALTDALHVERCSRDPGVLTFGLANALFPIGAQFLQIVSPVHDGHHGRSPTRQAWPPSQGHPGAIVSIDAADQPAEWPCAGPAWRQHVDATRVSWIAGMTGPSTSWRRSVKSGPRSSARP